MLTLKEKIDKYLDAPNFWGKKISAVAGDRNADILFKIYIDGMHHAEIGRVYSITDARINQLSREVFEQIAVKELFENTPIPPSENIVAKIRPEVLRVIQNKNVMNRYSSRRNAFTQEKYDQIKELLFRGEPRHDIAKIVHCSTETVRAIAKSSSLDEFKSKHKPLKIIPIPISEPTIAIPSLPLVLLDLDEMREQFDEVLADFIVNQVRKVHGELLRENEQLKAQLAAPKKPSLQERIQIQLQANKPIVVDSDENI